MNPWQKEREDLWREIADGFGVKIADLELTHNDERGLLRLISVRRQIAGRK